MMNKLKIFLLGAKEFRSDFTTNRGKDQELYDLGREWAHRLTFRRFDQ